MPLKRGALTWYCYLLSGLFTVFLNIQGNIIPFLRVELGLSYRAVSLHPSAIALGMIAAGLTTDPVLRVLGRRRTLLLAVGGSMAGALLQVVAAGPVVSIGGCLLIGLTGAMIPGVIAGVLAQLHGARRDQAYAECGAVTYGCVVASSLLVGGTLALGLNWRVTVLVAVLLGGALVATLGRAAIPPPPAPSRSALAGGRLPLASVLFLVTLGLGVALEYAAVLWAPTYLEHQVGLARAAAAAGAAVFAAAMVAGRWAGSLIVRRVAPAVLYPRALALVAPGFLLYWGVATPVAAVAGLAVIGLAVALLYPLTIGLAMSAAGPLGAVAGIRSAFAAGAALLLSPLLLGGLVDGVGLRWAHLAMPVLAAAGVLCFAAARLLDRRRTQVAMSG